jgi:hypothetical protein
LPRKSINSREYFNENLESNRNKRSTSFFNCCSGETEKYESKGFGLRPEVRPRVDHDKNYMDISRSILEEQEKVL